MNEKKLIQIAAIILNRNNGRINYTKLIKLIYLANRAFINKTGDFMIDDILCSMKNGPVLSGLYDLIKGNYKDKKVQSVWDYFFKTESYDLCALKDVPFKELSRAEKNILEQIESRFHDYSYQYMIDYTHKNCPEWEDTKSSSKMISDRTLYEAIGCFTKDQIEYFLSEREIYKKENQILAAL